MRRALRDNPAYVARRLLEVRPRSVGEVRERLREKGFSEGDIERAVNDLAAADLLNDERFARELVESALRRKPVGPRWLAAKLHQHHVPVAIARAVIGELLPPERERDCARTAAEHKRAELVRRRPPLPSISEQPSVSAGPSPDGRPSLDGSRDGRLRRAGLSDLGPQSSARLARYLAARGFSPAVIRDVLQGVEPHV